MKPSRSRISVELDERDVKNDLAKIVNAMSKIRNETSADHNYSDEQKDEYLHLAYRLASCITGIAGEDTIKRMDNVAKTIDKDERLLWYDYSQESYWRKHNPNFANTLDKVVIGIMKDDFNNLESKHHIVQAIKFLGVSEAPFEEKEKVYATILPYTGRVRGFKKSNGLIEAVKRILGYSYKIQEDTDLKLRVSGNSEFLPELIEEARGLGYTELEIDMFHKDFEDLKKSDLEGKVVEKDVDREIFGIKNAKGKFNKIANSLVKFTLPISYPILGSLPGSLQERISKNLEDYNSRPASIASNWTGFALGLGAAAIGGVTADIPPSVAWFGFYTALESFLRGYATTRRYNSRLDAEKDKVGRLTLFPITYPIKLELARLDKRGSYIRANFKLKDADKKTKDKGKSIPDNEDSVNMFDYFTNVAQIQIPENLEESLVWSTQNHHHYGREFSSYLEQATTKLDKKPSYEKNFDRKNQKYALFASKQVDDYDKFTMLSCSKDARYVLSFILNKDEQPNEKYVEICNEILSSDKPLLEKTKDITTRLNTAYTHLAKFEKSNLVGDYEIIS